MGDFKIQKWTKEEEEIIHRYIEKEKTKEPGTYDKIIAELEEVTGKVRPHGSIRNKLGRLRGRLGIATPTGIDISKYPVHETLRLLDQPFDRGGYAKYTLMCQFGHMIEKEPTEWKAGCNVCKGDFVGGTPKNDFRAAVVYLIYIRELKAIKVGYATGEGQEAIIKRFTRWPMPYEYEILAYDQSTRSEAAEHEQWLLNNTLDYNYFTERQHFAGWTEFRHQSIVKDLLPEYETVLDKAFKI